MNLYKICTITEFDEAFCIAAAISKTSLWCARFDSVQFFFLYHFRFAVYIVVLIGIGTIVPFILFVCFFIIFFGSPYTWLLAQLCGGWVYGACLRTNRSLPSPRESEGETIKEATRRDKVLCNIIHDSERRKYVRRKSNQIICKIRDVKCAVLTFVIFFFCQQNNSFSISILLLHASYSVAFVAQTRSFIQHQHFEIGMMRLL